MLTLEQATALIETTPAIAWLSYNVHGNEASTAEAALQVAYQLAAGEDEQTQLILHNCVVIIDPLVNPDGHDRYVYFYRGQRGVEPNADPNAVEHLEPWPGGRFNHYLFDLNRDWAWQSQPESRARIAAYREWNPQLHVDYHEMSSESTYFFFPPAEPIQENIAALLKPWWERYGRANAAAFDRYKVRYYSGEDYDVFYPAYGDSWPSLNGAVGMTYEQAGGGFGGLVVELGEKRGRLTLRERIWHHYLTSLASLATTAQYRRERLRDYYEFRRRAIEAGRSGRVKQYVLLAEPDPERTARVVEILLRQGIEVSRAQKLFVAEQVVDYTAQTQARKEFPAGSYVVDLAQPAGFLAEALLTQEIPVKTHFFYDVTGWSLPLAAGVETYALGKAVSVESVSLSARPEVPGGLIGSTTPTAYLFRWQSDGAARLLARLLAEDYKAYVAVKAFTLAGEKYAAGTIVLPVSDNPTGLAARLAELAVAEGVTVQAVETQWTEEGIDLGSRRIEFLRKPKVAVVMDTPVNASLYGALWFLFDYQVRLPFTALRAEELSRVNLDDYNVLVLPPDSGDGRGYDRIISKNLRERIGSWIRGGGVLIGIKGGAVFATRQKAGWASLGYRLSLIHISEPTRPY